MSDARKWANKRAGGLLALLLALVMGSSWGATVSFVSLGTGNRILVIDAATHRPIRSLLGMRNPQSLAPIPGGLLIAGSYDERSEGNLRGEIYVVDVAHGHAVFTESVPGRIQWQALMPEGREVVSTHPGWNGISVFDVVGLRVKKYLKTGPRPSQAVAARSTPMLYVSNSGDGTVTEVDREQWEVTRQIQVGPAPKDMLMARDDRRLFVSHSGGNSLSVVALPSGTVERQIPMPGGIQSMDLGDDGRTLFTVQSASDRLQALDVETGKTRELSLGAGAGRVAVIPGTGMLYVAGAQTPVLWVVNQRSLALVTTIELPAGEAHQISGLAGVELGEVNPRGSELRR